MKSFEMLEFKYLERTLTHENCINEENKRQIKFNERRHVSAYCLVYFCLLSKIMDIKTWTNVIVPVDSYGFETWSLILK